MDYAILPPDEIIDTTVNLPLSKSISARLLIIHALTPDGGPLPPLAECDDTRALTHALDITSGTIDIGPAGTAMRFATAYHAAMPGHDVVIQGTERMHRRPIGVLVDALRNLGADIEYLDKEGFPPLHIRGRRLHGGELTVDASVSSQYLSALAMIGPTLDAPLDITLENTPASVPYLRLTLDMMRRHGVRAELSGMHLNVEPGTYSSPEGLTVEPDWSAASYWYAIAALSAGWINLPGLCDESAQGDRAIAAYAERLGVLTSFEDDDESPSGAHLSASPEVFNRLDLDMSATPDLVQTLAVAAPLIGVPFRFSGVHTLRDKETDRVAALCDEALKLGFVFTTEGNDVLAWEGKRVPVFELPVIDTRGDHRMAMAFAPAAIFIPGIVISHAEVVTKSYPGFWDDLSAAGFTLADPATLADNTDQNDITAQDSSDQNPTSRTETTDPSPMSDR